MDPCENCIDLSPKLTGSILPSYSSFFDSEEDSSLLYPHLPPRLFCLGQELKADPPACGLRGCQEAKSWK